MKRLTSLILVFLISCTAIYAQCSIEITNISVAGPGNPAPAVHLVVSGFVNNPGCTRVQIELCCKDASNPCRTQTTEVNPDKSFSTLFKDFVCKCVSNSFVVVAKATCASNPDCTPAKREFTIDCAPVNACPQILNVTSTAGNCISDTSGCQKRDVTFTPAVSGSCDGYSWNFGDNSPDVNGIGPPGVTVHSYFHLPQAIPRLTVFKAGCNPISHNIVLPDFPPCHECPANAAINLNQLTVNNCILTGTITADFCEEQYVTAIITYGDATSETININNLNGKIINHTYASNGSYNFQIILQRNGSNCTYSKSISIANCSTDGGGGNGGGNGGCGWRFWKCICGILAFLVGLYIASRLVLVAGGWSINLPNQPLTWGVILEALGAGFALWIMAICPCETAYMIIAGATLGILVIIIMLIGGVTLPKWLEAILIGIALIIVMSLFVLKHGC